MEVIEDFSSWTISELLQEIRESSARIHALRADTFHLEGVAQIEIHSREQDHAEPDFERS